MRKARLALDFTLSKYEELLQTLLGQNLKIFTVSSYLEERPGSNFAILRHDVDRKPINALRMAELENRKGIKSTYYFRYVKGVFKPEIIRRIHGLGHEIGYHYETLSKTKGDYKKALKMFEYELYEFRKICEVKTIAMHGSHLSKYDNRNLWKCYDFKQLGVLGEAYISVKDVNYFSDTGRNWGLRNNIRDHIDDYPLVNQYYLNTTDELIDLIKSKKVDKLYLSIHPERWTSSRIEWIQCYLRDMAFNIGKRFLARRLW